MDQSFLGSWEIYLQKHEHWGKIICIIWAVMFIERVQMMIMIIHEAAAERSSYSSGRKMSSERSGDWNETNFTSKHAGVTEVHKAADKAAADLHPGFCVDIKSSCLSESVSAPSNHFQAVTTSWKSPIMWGIVLNADCISAAPRRQRPHLIFTTGSLLGVTRGQGQVPRVRLESRLKCCEKPHSAARDEKNNNVDMAFPLWQ